MFEESLFHLFLGVNLELFLLDLAELVLEDFAVLDLVLVRPDPLNVPQGLVHLELGAGRLAHRTQEIISVITVFVQQEILPALITTATSGFAGALFLLFDEML